jgi:hypothetical protein
MSSANVGSQGELLHLRAVRGNNIGPFRVTWKDETTGLPIDITGCTFLSRIRISKTQDFIADFTVNIIDGPAGIFEFFLSFEDSTLLPLDKVLVYFLSITTLDNVKRPLLYGYVHLRPLL